MTLDELKNEHATISGRSKSLEKLMIRYYNENTLSQYDKKIQFIKLIAKSNQINIDYECLIEIFPLVEKPIESLSVLADIHYDYAVHLHGTAIFCNNLSKKARGLPYNEKASSQMTEAFKLYKKTLQNPPEILKKNSRTPQQNYDKASKMLAMLKHKLTDPPAP